METKTLTIRLPKSIWLKLRRLQESGKIKSIQQAVIEGLEWVIKNN